MATLTGISTAAGIGYSAAGTWGTAVNATEKLVFESLSFSENVNKLQSAGIGSGGVFSDNMQRGAISVSGQLSGIVGYDNGLPLMIAQFLGSDTATETTNPEGDYQHVITFNTTTNADFYTLAFESSSTTVLEFASCVTTGLTITVDTAQEFARYTVDFLADSLTTSSTENTNAELQALTQTNSEYAIVDAADEFQINAQGGGALSTSDALDITSYTLTLTRSQSFIQEIKGSAGNGEPVIDDKTTGTLSVGLKAVEDNTYFTAAQSSTEYKSLLSFDGSQIGSGTNHEYILNLPRMVLIETPDFGLSNPGTNPYSLTFDVLEASANPTGMSDTRPYVELTNQTTTAYT